MSKIVVDPKFLSDRLETEAAYMEAKALLADQFGISDPEVLAIFDTKALLANQAAAADLAAFGQTDTTNAAPLTTYQGTTYAIDSTTTPPTLVPDPGVDATTIPVAGSTPPVENPPVETPPVETTTAPTAVA